MDSSAAVVANDGRDVRRHLDVERQPDAVSFLLVPPGTRCRLSRLEGEDIAQFWLLFKPNPDATTMRAIPHVRRLESDVEYVQRQFREALDDFPLTRTRLYIWAWHLLWSIGENAATTPEATDTADLQAFVEEH